MIDSEKFNVLHLSRTVSRSANFVTERFMQSITYKHTNEFIKGVLVKDLEVILDGRGSITELWKKIWIKDGFIQPRHIYQSSTDFNVVKAWHLHDIHTDQFVITRGKVQVALMDLREGSETFGYVNNIFSGTTNPKIILIPPMVLHGWKSLSSPEVLVTNLQTHPYDPKDEWRFDWDCVLSNIWQPKNG